MKLYQWNGVYKKVKTLKSKKSSYIDKKAKKGKNLTAFNPATAFNVSFFTGTVTLTPKLATLFL